MTEGRIITMPVAKETDTRREDSCISKKGKTMISPDDILTDEDIADIEQARVEFARGEAIPVNAINWD